MKYLHLILNIHCVLLLVNNALCLKSDHNLQMIGGMDHHPEGFGYVVAIVTKEERLLCTGGILNDWYILTAAHCFFHRYRGYIRHTKYYVIAGTADARKLGNGYTILVEKVLMPFPYNRLTEEPDIAVLRLTKSLMLSEHRNLAALNLPKSESDIQMFGITIIAAYGASKVKYFFDFKTNKLDECIKQTGILKHSTCIVIDNDDCQFEIPGLPDSQFCCKLLSQNPIGSMCYGDSGAPLLKNGFLIGISIFSHNNEYCDESELPIAYLIIEPHLKFMEGAITENPDWKTISTYEV